MQARMQGLLDTGGTPHYRADGPMDQKGLAKVNGGLTAPTRRRILGIFGASVSASAFLSACGGESGSAPAAGAPSSGGASAKGEVRWQFRGSDEELKAAQSFVDRDRMSTRLNSSH